MLFVNAKRSVLLAFFCFFAAALLSACSEKTKSGFSLVELHGRTMGTTYSVKALADASWQSAQAALGSEVEQALLDYNMVMSTYIDDSEISRLNQQATGQWLDLSDEMRDIIQVSQKISEESQGAFDITIGPLVNLWGWGPTKPTKSPSEDELAAVKAKIGFHNIELKDNKLKKREDVYLDLSAIAKGHATDVIAGILESKGIHDYMVEIGGELKIRGHNSSGKTWTIGIEKPTVGRDGAMQAISGDNIAIATSGEYRNYYEENGIRVSHTIDPTTGYPIDHRLASVTVIAENGSLADAYATAINVLGPENGYQLAERLNLAVFFIIREQDGFVLKNTPEFKQYMVK